MDQLHIKLDEFHGLRRSAHVPRANQAIDIPNFFLFGEAPQTVGDRYLHLEALSDRSRPNNWNIRAHAHADLSHIFHISSGDGTMVAEDRIHAFAGPCALIVPAGVVHGFHFAPETEGTVLTISDLTRRIDVAQIRLGALFAAPAVAPLSGDAVPASLGRLAREMAWIAAGHGAAVEAHLLAILVECTRALEHARSVGRRGPAYRRLWWRGSGNWSSGTIAKAFRSTAMPPCSA